MNQQNRILKHSEILLRIERMSMEIGENHCDNGQLVLVGLNDRGYFVAELIRNYLNDIENVQVSGCIKLEVNKIHEYDLEKMIDFDSNTTVILIDDVLNTGNTAFKVLSSIYLLGVLKIETAFLAVREHLNFPILANYQGISIATTLQNHVEFDNSETNSLSVKLY
jgi:pyrimidine operon attenuation protein/uracil phosphoribosyltransferase